MAAQKITNLPSGSVDAVLKDAEADEFVKARKSATTGAFLFQPTTSTPNRPHAFKMVSDWLESRGYKVVNTKTEKDGSVSMNFELPDGGAPEIVDADCEWEIKNQTVIRFLNAPMLTEFPGGDNKVMVVKVVNLPAEIEEKDVAITVENRKLVMKLKTVLEDCGIQKFKELPDGVTVSAISTLMEDQTLTVTVALEKQDPKKKPKSMTSRIKRALNRAWPAFLAIGAKMGFDAATNDDAN
ncbi:hypothetical protein AB3S75_045163 [Citrus x aurantiifolia]